MSLLLFGSAAALPVLSLLSGTGTRESIVRSYVALFLLVAISTEALSAVDALTYTALWSFWLVVLAACIGGVASLLRRVDARGRIDRPLDGFRGMVRGELALAGTVAVILFLTLVTALLYPPNNWDSMTYHMPRVAQWIQHANVDFYPTSIDRQDYQPPLAEFAILHLQLLSGSDRFANLVQWYSFFVSIVLVTLLANELGLSRRAQWFAALVAATLPMAILQSSSTQNDLVTAAFCVGFAYFLLRVTSTLSWTDALFCAVSFGLALLTKGTAYVYCAGIGLAIGGAALLSRSQRRKPALFGMLAGIVIVGLSLNLGHYARHYGLYGFSSPPNASDIANEHVSPGIIVSNLVRNAALHAGTPVERLNAVGTRAVTGLLGDGANDPRSTVPTTTFDIPFTLHEDMAGNLPHLILLLSALLALPLVKIESRRPVYILAAAVVLSAVVYSTVLRWQPWASRLHTPVFMLSAPLVAAVATAVDARRHRVALALGAALLLYALPFLVMNPTRPLTTLVTQGLPSSEDRVRSYFANRTDLYEDYQAAARIIRDEGVDEVGLCFGYDDYEYPLWVLTGSAARRQSPGFRHVGIDNATSSLEPAGVVAPDLILSTKSPGWEAVPGAGAQAVDVCLDGDFTVIFDSATLRILRRG